MKKPLIIIPAYNPSANLLGYVEELITAKFTSILIVDDGSDVSHRSIFEKLNMKSEVTVIRHAINLGKGRALKNALNFFLTLPGQEDWSGVITVDSDGQHAVSDVIKLAKAFNHKKETIALGMRDFNKRDVPFKSKFGNKLTSGLFKLMYGRKLKDTQTGLRAISKDIIHHFISLSGERFSYETSVLIKAVNLNINIIEIPIRTIYINDNSETHFNPISDSIEIYRLLFNNFFKYTFASFLSFILDITFFHIMISTLATFEAGKRILIATIISRVTSATFNYFSNKLIVFKSKDKLTTTLLKYITLAVLLIFASSSLVFWINYILGVHETAIKIVVDLILFLISYRIQKNHIFK